MKKVNRRVEAIVGIAIRKGVISPRRAKKIIEAITQEGKYIRDFPSLNKCKMTWYETGTEGLTYMIYSFLGEDYEVVSLERQPAEIQKKFGQGTHKVTSRYL